MTEGRGQELLGTQIGAPGSTQLPLLEGGLAKARADPLWYSCLCPFSHSLPVYV